MKQLSELVIGSSQIKSLDIDFLNRLAMDWQIIADLSFADLALWVQLDSGDYIAIAHVRAATAATVFPEDFVGKQVSTLQVEESVELFPIFHDSRQIATLSKHRNPGLSRSIGRLESTYQDCAKQLIEMASEGTFPFETSISSLNPSPRVGDGFIRLNKDNEIVYASPNGRSAFSRLGWESELEGLKLSDVSHTISGQPNQN